LSVTEDVSEEIAECNVLLRYFSMFIDILYRMELAVIRGGIYE